MVKSVISKRRLIAILEVVLLEEHLYLQIDKI